MSDPDMAKPELSEIDKVLLLTTPREGCGAVYLFNTLHTVIWKTVQPIGLTLYSLMQRRYVRSRPLSRAMKAK